MELSFVYMPGFVREWERQLLTDTDLLALEQALYRSYGSAPVMKGAGGLRKMRFAAPSRHTGKSGAMRVGFAYFQVKAVIFVVALFSKNEAANFTPAQCAQIARLLKDAERDYR